MARSVSDPHLTVVSSISGYLFTGNPGQKITTNYMPCLPNAGCTNGTWGDNPVDPFGSHDPALRGRYHLAVPPGQYTIEIRELSNDGQIGPINPPFHLPGTEGYWDPNGPAATSTSPAVVTVSAGQVVDNINIVLDGDYPAFDMFEQPQSSSGSGMALRGIGVRQQAGGGK
jgi:hypothetical protein